MLGGLGRVWLAHDGSLGRDVALKEVRPERADSPAVWSRFLQEARVTGQLEHPGIVPIYELSRRPEDNNYVSVVCLVEAALASLTWKQYTPAVLDALRRAFAAGFGKDPVQKATGIFGDPVEHMERDADLVAVRGRDDYKKLLAELRAGGQDP